MSRTPHSSKSSAAPSALSTHWQTLGPREQHLVRAAALLVALALLWWLALAPALHTLRSAPARHAALDAQLQQTQALQAEAEALKNTDQLEIRVFGNPDAHHAVAVARLDNLGKGASGAAVQNLRLMLGL